jgi:membrane-associated phospholipid phosphatase
MTLEQRLWFISAIALVGVFALGYAVTHSAQLWRLDVEAAAIRGEGVPLAAVFTASGRALPLFILGVTGIAIAVFTRTNVVAAVAIFATQLVSQGAGEAVKHLFARARPDAWLGYRDMGFSYPSGHAMTAIVFFGSWGVLIALSALPRDVKIALCSILLLWMAGIDWSRLVLSAHYPTDILGGTLFGLAWSCALWATFVHFRVLTPG